MVSSILEAFIFFLLLFMIAALQGQILLLESELKKKGAGNDRKTKTAN